MSLILAIETDQYEYRQKFCIVDNVINFPFDKARQETPVSKSWNFEKNQVKQEEITAFCEFTEKEINKMPKEFRSDFRLGKVKARIRRRENGTYEIRCQLKKQKITASSKNLETAKESFIEKLKLASNPLTACVKKNVKVADYTKKWLETAKKPYVKPNTYKFYLQTFNTDILPAFGNRELTSIKQIELQEFINRYTEQGKYRTAKKIFQFLASVFDYAVFDELLQRSPMCKVKIPIYEQKHGEPFTREEEKSFIDKLKVEPTIYMQAFVFLVYTGLRRSELASVVIEDEWVYATTAKQRKGKKEKVRNIPISPMLSAVLSAIDIKAIVKLPVGVLSKHFKKYFPNHHLHDLRHTFITRCQECGIQRELVSLWAGHSADSSITSTVYTHLEQNKKHQIEEMQKFSYDL